MKHIDLFSKRLFRFLPFYNTILKLIHFNFLIPVFLLSLSSLIAPLLSSSSLLSWFVFVPIVEGLHWTLAVVANLDSLERAARIFRSPAHAQGLRRGVGGELRGIQRMRFVEKRQGVIILVFILLLLVMIIIYHPPPHPRRHGVSTGRHFLNGFTQHAQRAHRDRQPARLPSLRVGRAAQAHSQEGEKSGEPIEGDASIDATADALLSGMPIAQLAVPKQANGFDCGVFALQYAEEMMVRWPECRFQVEGFSDKVFTLNDINISRHHKNI